MGITKKDAPLKTDPDLREYLDNANADLTQQVNRNVTAAYGGLRTSDTIVDAVTTAFATFTGWDTDMPDQRGPDGVLVDSAAGTLQVTSKGIYQLHFHAQGYGPASAMDWQVIKNGSAYAAVPTENMAVAPNAKYVAGIALQLELEKGDTLAVQWKNASNGTSSVEGSLALHRISPSFD